MSAFGKMVCVTLAPMSWLGEISVGGMRNAKLWPMFIKIKSIVKCFWYRGIVWFNPIMQKSDSALQYQAYRHWQNHINSLRPSDASMHQ